ncbi:hypothetical protein [Nitrosomonas sp. Nm166]|uniref:hypothetical protein n=1 Tax=Nitrosomonas sp. Nm166 TaxID=1881054 RepID=UPI0008EAA13F|nr:hypothetical protein [Nitrosomonas sp. Nm166]SFE12549.1 hypothetical protein SAMN05428977_100748 [Nitrosomonas sp. Nm166]
MYNSKVTITDKISNNVVMEYIIDLHSNDVSVADYFDEAWECAVDESLVNPLRRSDYEFILVEETIH